MDSLQKPKYCLEHYGNSFFIHGKNKRKSFREFFYQKINLTYNYYATNPSEGTLKIVKKDLVADIIDINEEGPGI